MYPTPLYRAVFSIWRISRYVADWLHGLRGQLAYGLSNTLLLSTRNSKQMPTQSPQATSCSFKRAVFQRLDQRKLNYSADSRQKR